jgi:hypothetical protein
MRKRRGGIEAIEAPVRRIQMTGFDRRNECSGSSKIAQIGRGAGERRREIETGAGSLKQKGHGECRALIWFR